jgi:predicted membrane protein
MVNFPGSGVWDWDLALTDKVPLNLELTMGAGDMNADLAGIILTDLNLSQGVGQLTVLLTDKGDYRAEINQAIGSIEVGIPKGTGVRIEVSKAISSLSMPSGLEKRGGYYYSSNYDQADQQIELDISQAIGSIVLNFE